MTNVWLLATLDNGNNEDVVNQRERGSQKDYRYLTSCYADQRRNPPLTHSKRTIKALIA